MAARKPPRSNAASTSPQTKVKLLSGGNPQIAKGDGPAVVEAYLGAMPGWKQGVGRRLDTLIVAAVPGVLKAVRWNSPFYGTAEHGWFVSFHCLNRYVKVAFFAGTSLSPVPPVESKMPGTRYYHILENDPPDDRLLTNWFRQASRLPGWSKFGD